MKTVLITGGAGFIGSHISKRLLDEGNRVLCVDNLLTGSEANIASLKSNQQFSFINADVSKPLESPTVTDSKIDYIFHIASPASPNAKSARSYIALPMETLLTNSNGTYLLLELAKKNNAGFLFTSTSEVYGDPEVSPQPESYFGYVNPNGVRSVYDESKRFGEAITFAFLRKFDTNVRIVRLFNTYGPHMQKDDGRVVSNFINQALEEKPLTIFGDGTQTRSFCYVDDTVEAIIRAMFKPNTKGEVINIGNQDERQVKEIASFIKELVNSNSEIEYEPLPMDDPKQRKPDITKAKKLLDWEPKIGLEEGLKKTIEYFRTV